jgi:hypothetical protein
MTPEQKLKWAILMKVAQWSDENPPDVTAENVDRLYELADDADALCDAREEIRCSGIDTDIKCDWSRHYESKSVAAQMPDLSWVGWTYWYGGGKHAEPSAIDWMDSAYDLDCKEEEKVVTVRTFSKRQEQPA